MLDDFKLIPIWQVFEKKNTNKYNLDPLAIHALGLLDMYYKAFPKFTLHNRQHAKNILRLAGEILGDHLNKMSALECAVIILCAFFHDIGMVFSDRELTAIEQESAFKVFLDENYKAKLLFQDNGEKVNAELIEWYCRWMHAKRVWQFLDILEEHKWGNISLRESVGNVCESHNESASYLEDDSKFETNFIGEADLKFCGILLRLADILDFDTSRTPKSVYEFLDLDNPKNKNELISRDEWNKHLCSDGFKFSYKDEQTELSFVSGPPHPQIEANIHSFLNIIEDELRNCAIVLNKCSTKWRNLRLPLQIDRSGIKSQNYKKGEYRLSLDENQIIKLLVGDNLYVMIWSFCESFCKMQLTLAGCVNSTNFRMEIMIS